ncbi:MAG: AAA family ATPase, partial [Trichlorobacter sp.]
MRPRTLAEFCGQGHLLGPGKALLKMIESDQVPSLILWGPPGCGKTTLAHILANETKARFVFFSAIMAGVKEVREIFKEAEERASRGVRTILFVDEIHRFNKAQQDAFLPAVEKGLVTVIGATTENPSFEVIAPLLSRCRVLKLQQLQTEELILLLRRALEDEERGLGGQGLTIDDSAISFLAEAAQGDG